MVGQLVTLTEARLMAALLTAKGVGGGVMPEDPTDNYNNEFSGIYIDPTWVNAGNQPQQGVGDRLPYRVKFNVGWSANIGLMFDIAEGQAAKGQPPRWDIAIQRIKKEIEEWMRGT